MSRRKAVLLFAMALILQLGLVNVTSIQGIAPNLLLCLGITMGFRYQDGIVPALTGLPFFLALDIISGQYAGVAALCYLIVILLLAYFGRDLNREHWLPLVAMTLSGILVYYLVYWVILALLGNPSGILRLFHFLPIALSANLASIFIIDFMRRKGARRAAGSMEKSLQRAVPRRRRNKNRYFQ